MDSEWSVLKKNSSLHKKTQKNSEDYSLVGELQNPLVWGSHQSWKAGDHNMAPFVLNWDFEHKRNGWEWLHMETALWSERGRAHTDSTYIPDTHTLLGWCRVRRGKKAFANTERLLATPKVRHLIPTFATVKKKKKEKPALECGGGKQAQKGHSCQSCLSFSPPCLEPKSKASFLFLMPKKRGRKEKTG